MPPSIRPNLHRITSPSNSLIKVFRRALSDGMSAQGWVAVEGPIILEEIRHSQALDRPRGPILSRSRIRSVLVSDERARDYGHLLEQFTGDVEIAQTTNQIFRGIARTVNPQGIAALVEVRAPELGLVLAQHNVVLVVACGVQDPGNLGTILRAAEAFSAGALLTIRSTVSAFNPKAVRSSGGATFRLPVYTGLDADQVFDRLAAAGIRIAAADPRGQSPISGEDLRGPLAFLIGNETAGLDTKIARHASLRLRIPIRPGVDSINAALSAGILLYEAARQREFRY